LTCQLALFVYDRVIIWGERSGFRIDTAFVESQGLMGGAPTLTVKDELAKNMYQQAEFGWLIDHDLAGHTQLALRGNVRKYLNNLTEYDLLE